MRIIKLSMLLFFLGIFYKNYGQVNLQTGSAVFSLPMFSWQDSKSRLHLNNALNYNSGNGLKVNEIASNIGTNWSLDAGGVITRIQVGQPDDQKEKTGLSSDIRKLPPGYLYNNRAGNVECPIGLEKYPIFGNENHIFKQHNAVDADRELDYFLFQMNGRKGTFVLNKIEPDKCFVIGDSKLKISYETDENTTNYRTTIISFQIIDESGLIYKFKNIGVTSVLRTFPCDAQRNILSTQPIRTPGHIYYEYSIPDNLSSIVNSWHLSEIIDPLANRKISFNYLHQQVDSYLGYDAIFQSKVWERVSNGTTNSTSIKHYGYITVNYKRSSSTIPVLTAINFPDGYHIDFSYKANPRIDLDGDYALEKVEVSLKSQIQKGFVLKTAYLWKNEIKESVTTNFNAARLCLVSVQEYGPNIMNSYPPYKFDYNLGTNDTEDFVPPMFCANRDYGGYYNGDFATIAGNEILPQSTGIESLTFEQLENACFIKNDPSGTVTSGGGVTYPPGKFIESSEIIVTSKSGYAKNGLLKRITYPTKGYLEYEYEQNIGKINNQGTDIIVSGVHISKVKTYNDNSLDAATITKYSYIKSDGTSSLWGVESPKNKYSLSSRYDAEDKELDWSGCYWSYRYPGISVREQAIEYPVETMSDFNKGVYMGIKTFFAATGYGQLMSLIEVALQLIVSCTGSNTNEDITIFYSNSDLNSSNPLPIQFAAVEIEQIGSLPNNGKTRYEFTNIEDYPLWNSFGDNPDFTMKPRSAGWQYGLPKIISIYDGNNKLIKQTSTSYNTITNPYTGPSTISCNCATKWMGSIIYESETGGYWMNYANASNTSLYNTSSTPNITLTQYGYQSGRLEARITTERNYRPNYSGLSSDPANYSENQIEYTYNLNNYQVSKTTTTKSNGDKIIKEIYYPHDYTSTGIMQTMKNSNLINIPIASYESIKKNGTGPQEYLSANVTEFDLVNGDIKPVSIYVGRPATPIPYNFDPTSPKNFTGLIKTQDLYYDSKSNLTGLKDEGGHVISNIYGYNDRFMIASVVNADLSIDKPAYTSFENNELGGFTISTAPVYLDIKAVTGNRVLSLNGSIVISAALNNAKAYTLSFWATSSSVAPSSVTAKLIKSTPTLNGYTYYEYQIEAGVNSISLDGTGNIDELRLYPNNSRMRTVCYDHILGKIAECDENSRITYYEYDELGRLLFTRDERKNIIKMYDYNFKQ